MSLLEVPRIKVDRSGFSKPPRRESRITRPEDRDYFESFLGILAELGLSDDSLVLRGFDGAPVLRGEDDVDESRKESIWVLDAKFTRWALEGTATAEAICYAERHAIPCVGVYDMEKLRVAEEGEPEIGLRELSESRREGVFNRVTHIDYPAELPSAALQKLVFFEYE